MAKKVLFEPKYTDRITLLSTYGSAHIRSIRYACGHTGAHAYVIKVPPRLVAALRPQGLISNVGSNFIDVLAIHHPKAEGFDRIGAADAALCVDCRIKRLKESTLRCCTCGEEIIAGSPIVLSHANRVRVDNLSSILSYDESRRFVGCTEGACAGGSVPAIRWTGTAFDPAVTPGHFLKARPPVRALRSPRNRKGGRRPSDSPTT